MQAIDILKKWLTYTDYNPERKSFALGSLIYEYHRCNETISKFSPYNPTGELAVLYAKQKYEKILRESRLSALEVVRNPAALQPDIEMWNLLHSPEVNAIETAVLEDFNDLISHVIPATMIGQRDLDAEKNSLLGSVDAVVTSIHKCNVDLFLRGGPIGRISNFSTHIHVFNQLSQCLLTLEQSPDGMYLCYISNYGAVDGYFGFYIKSNGTILSINERLHEAFPGGHKRHRNNRYAEEKQYGLFPYDFIFSFEETNPDYKGYATSHVINEEQLAFFKLSPNAYLPLVIAMVLLRNRYDGFDPSELEIQYVDALLPVNLALPTPMTQALMIPGDSQIAEVNRGLKLEISEQQVLDGSMVEMLGRPATDCKDESRFGFYQKPAEQVFIELYGQDFKLDTSTLLESNRHLKHLPATQLATTTLTPDAEFVGNARKMTQIAYMNGRAQLVAHIRDKMFEAYKAQGGAEGIRDWWNKTLPTIRKKLIALCVERYNNGDDHKKLVGDGHIRVLMNLDCKERPNHFYGIPYPLNAVGLTASGYKDISHPLCCITGSKSSAYFTFAIDSYEQIAYLAGAENVPGILKGYLKEGHRTYGNSILEVTDPMTNVGTPFEDNEYLVNQRLWSRSKWEDYIRNHFDDYCPKEQQYKPYWPSDFIPENAPNERSEIEFSFAIGFSKRGLAKILKEGA